MNKNKKSIFNNFLDKFKRNKKESDPKVNNNKKEENSFPITDEEKRKLIWKFDGFVRDNYPNLPLDEFKIEYCDVDRIKKGLKDKSLCANDLNPVVNKMIKHLNQTFNYAFVDVNKVEIGELNTAGFVDSFKHKIVVNYHELMNSDNILAILAHEVSHCYQYYESLKYIGSTEEIEKFTDFLTIYLGFGKLTLAGKEYCIIGGGVEHRGVLGYLDKYSLMFAITTSNGRKEIKKILNDDKMKLSIIKKRSDQLVNIFSSYKENISSVSMRFNYFSNITEADSKLISELMYKNSQIDINYFMSIVQDIENFSEIEEFEKKEKLLNKKLKELYDIYILINEIYDKYK